MSHHLHPPRLGGRKQELPDGSGATECRDPRALVLLSEKTHAWEPPDQEHSHGTFHEQEVCTCWVKSQRNGGCFFQPLAVFVKYRAKNISHASLMYDSLGCIFHGCWTLLICTLNVPRSSPKSFSIKVTSWHHTSAYLESHLNNWKWSLCFQWCPRYYHIDFKREFLGHLGFEALILSEIAAQGGTNSVRGHTEM